MRKERALFEVQCVDRLSGQSVAAEKFELAHSSRWFATPSVFLRCEPGIGSVTQVAHACFSINPSLSSLSTSICAYVQQNRDRAKPGPRTIRASERNRGDGCVVRLLFLQQ